MAAADWARLFLQMAPPAAVRRAFTAAEAWRSLDSQDALACLASQADLSRAYRQRVLKPLLAELQQDRSVELSERLIDAYMECLNGGGEISASQAPGWSHLTFFLREGTALKLRTREVVGGGAETGCVLWDASKALSAWLLRQPSEVLALDGLHVLELGAGPGLVGLCIAMLTQARVSLTDIVPQTLENLSHNVSLLPKDASSRARVFPLDWLEVHGVAPSKPSHTLSSASSWPLTILATARSPDKCRVYPQPSSSAMQIMMMISIIIIA